MKKIYMLSIGILVSTSYSWAQPTISAAQLNPVIGESISIVQSDWMPAGSGGNNVTWDFSSLGNNETATINILGPNASFPGSNQTHETTSSNGAVSNSFMEITATGQLQHGFDFTFSGATLSYTYSNSEKLLELPLTINTTYTDTYSGTFSLAGIPGTRDGNVSLEVDGYGTIITPSGTYTDVLRVRFENTNTDISVIGESTSSQVTYLWYKAGIHYPIVYLTENIGEPDLNEGAYYAGSSLTISQLNKNHISIYPNPVDDKIYVSVDADIKTIRLLDVVGHEVKNLTNDFTAEAIDLSDLNAGVYQLLIELSNGEFISTSIVKN